MILLLSTYHYRPLFGYLLTYAFDYEADIHYAKTWSEATEMIPRLFKGEIEESKFARWRDERIMVSC